MGGSTTEYSVYPEVLERLLREARPNSGVELLNSGMRTWTTKHTLIEYATYARRLEPDLVIVMHGINDLTRSCEAPDFTRGPYNDDWSHFYFTTINTVTPKTFERHLFQKYLGITSSLYGHEEVDYPVSHFHSLGPFEQHLAAIANYVAADGAKLVLVTQPSDWEITPVLLARGQGTFGSIMCKSNAGFLRWAWPSPGSMRRALAAFNEAIRRTGAATNNLVVDAAAEIPEDERYFSDEVHHTEKGGRLIAELVANAILDAGLLDSQD